MDGRCAIFVDAGFLLGAGGTRVSGTSLRSATTVEVGPLITAIVEQVAADCGLDPLRIYWYDATPDAAFTPQHKQIALLPDVKVRLGRIGVSGSQKGVDLRLALDLIGVARNRAACTAYLLTGDDDLTEAIEAAQDLGMKVKLVGIEDADHRLGVMSVAEQLALQVDGLLRLPTSLISEHFHPTRSAAPTPATVGPGAVSRPDPSVLARSHPITPAAGRTNGNGQTPDGSGSTDTSAIAQRTTVVTAELLQAADEVGRIVAEKLFETTTEAQLEEIKSDEPVLPRHLDVVLLKDCASRIGEPSTDLQPIRRTLRSAFWTRLNEMH
ncbi:NYN domain-containing protein [Microlunatus soli]|uniref:NYN domain-containing protein n=1 Tax=Microlunatus soli TaxID=630515 RepID=A0A1H1T8U5_9ACTN|nr:NYN domain-containing protein [Microlunatus soli]SDS56598.1 NYN domain-containing protein [Microlunatus soli]